ncbi:hypothetical protein [Streptomyces yangpuensis]|uniref:hypothetical protein n=1 Tax=Streptomyces yangpuensis TaxID=1648182 RepID=UPI0006295354|nr:hypothetical protein [Streptomyces yangpuensis]
MGFGGVSGGQRRGHVLLLAGDAAIRRGGVLVAPGVNVAALAMVPADALLGCGVPADMVCLEGVRDPNTVLARLRVAVAAEGPLFVYVSGRLTADRRGRGRGHGRGRGLFVALAGTTAASVRYTSLPWEWLLGELRSRTAGETTVVVDLVADKAAWPLVEETGTLPGLAGLAGVEAFGVVCGPGAPAAVGGVSGYTRQWIDQLRRAPVRPSNVELHVLAAGSAGLAPGTLVVPSARELETRSVPAPVPVPAPEPVAFSGTARVVEAAEAVTGSLPVVGTEDPRARLHALAMRGRHAEADALARTWERWVVERSGQASAEAVQCGEIRADLARMAGDFAAATRLWTAAGRARLALQGADAAEVQDAAAGALYCWTQLKDRAGALELGPALVGLLRALPLLDPDRLRLAERRLETLRTPAGAPHGSRVVRS